MSDIKLFQLHKNGVSELDGKSVSLEKSLQSIIERDLETFLGVTFLASEYSTGRKHGGRIDSLGIDENNCPVIIEYKRSINENVINQGLYYLDWLLDHKAEFELLVLKSQNKNIADKIEWSTPRLLCIAGDFTKYDEHAVQQINRNIELIRYRHFGDEFLMFELVNATTAQDIDHEKTPGKYKTVSEILQELDSELTDRFESIKNFLMALGDDVQMKILNYYVAFKRLQNFACVEVHPKNRSIVIFVKINPDTVPLLDGFTRDVRTVGHYGTGDLEIIISNDDDFERSKELLLRSYEKS